MRRSKRCAERCLSRRNALYNVTSTNLDKIIMAVFNTTKEATMFERILSARQQQ
ncbi:hypothetical protein K6W12_20580 [Burkholderia multivorans]|uniref:hypothetical protein n=1 Tax=Burkholderia multivorans TaxID=87883 RepID=UPI001C96B8F3|nr:hypothetical protein [Burkholderia multivorans]MBY4673034.1 hypothetical protein [Burkholderia multivorans]